MAERENPNEQTQKPAAWSAGVVGPTICYVIAVIIAIDIVAIELGDLPVPYSGWLHLTPLVVPGVCFLIWRCVCEKQPVLGSIIPILVCYTIIFAFPSYVRMKAARIPVTQWNALDFYKLESELGFPVSASSSSEGSVVIVAPEHEQRMRAELKRLGILRKVKTP